MKKNFIFLAVSLFFLLPQLALAQSARIIGLRGKVMVRQQESSPWKKAGINMALDKSAEIETKENANCTLSFDQARKNVVTMKSSSYLKLASVKPADLYLKEGRVFALIENLQKSEKFQIRTPTAIAGARGTGWGTDFHNNQTGVMCFENTIFTNGLDNSGNPTGEQDVNAGNGLDIGPGGVMGGLFNLDEADYEEWDDFLGYLEDLKNNESGSGDYGEDDALQDALDEQREDYGDFMGEDRRRDAMGGESSSGSEPESHPEEKRTEE